MSWGIPTTHPVFAFAVVIVLLGTSGCHQPNATNQPNSSAVTDTDPTDLLSAFKATYGAPSPANLAVPDSVGLSPTQIAMSAPSSASTALLLSPAQLLGLQSGLFILISKGVDPVGCHACGGVLAVNYLKKTPTGFDVLTRPEFIGPRGSFGEAPSYSIRNDLFNGLALQVTSSDGAQGCGGEDAGIYELGPLGLIVHGSNILISFSNEGEGDFIPSKKINITGTIQPDTSSEAGDAPYGQDAPQRRVRTFKVVYTGSMKAVVHYASDGVPLQQVKLPSC